MKIESFDNVDWLHFNTQAKIQIKSSHRRVRKQRKDHRNKQTDRQINKQASYLASEAASTLVLWWLNKQTNKGKAKAITKKQTSWKLKITWPKRTEVASTLVLWMVEQTNKQQTNKLLTWPLSPLPVASTCVVVVEQTNRQTNPCYFLKQIVHYHASEVARPSNLLYM